MEEVSRLQMNLQRLQESTAQTTSRLEEELEARRQLINRLEAKLERQKDYDELKREISVLRSVDLSQIPTGESGKSLEQVLIERSKALQQAETLKPPSTPDALAPKPTIRKHEDEDRRGTQICGRYSQYLPWVPWTIVSGTEFIMNRSEEWERDRGRYCNVTPFRSSLPRRFSLYVYAYGSAACQSHFHVHST
ncbi:hypothetical protein TSAR_011797 [Trichomalopsis sarcophagae]|uniref:Uncharacterized protein n=1 Tax=Trichomalopsis sarcophagae TaxID=543379 RepID=A0A232FG01_9HYME|nr:hypothetical protein TSAR_011797 [Trichomalopsis sarcophagae]